MMYPRILQDVLHVVILNLFQCLLSLKPIEQSKLIIVIIENHKMYKFHLEISS